MKANGGYKSDFGTGDVESGSPLDFDNLEPASRVGSTCETYTCRHHRRKVFVKRLKEEFRFSALHRAALDKEFDIGVTLDHRALPRYIEFHGDYILMDFIEGETLAELMAAGDPWLTDKNNVWRLFAQLLDVLEYLHNRHVVHCDVKPDNILLTAEGRQVMLVDLDKCHTDWLDDTSGSPALYGMDSEETPGAGLDFCGVAFVAECLMESFPELRTRRLERFAAMCRAHGASHRRLKAYVDRRLKVSGTWRFFVAGAVIAGLIIALTVQTQRYNAEKALARTARARVDTVFIAAEASMSPEIAADYRDYVDNGRRQQSLKSIIAKEYPAFLAPVLKDLDNFKNALESGDVSDSELGDLMAAIIRKAVLPDSAVEHICRKYPDFEAAEVWKAVTEDAGYYDLTKKQERLANQFADTLNAHLMSH